MYYNNRQVPHIGTRPVSPGFVAGSVMPAVGVASVAPVVTAAPALVTSTVAPVVSSVAPVISAVGPAVTTTQVVADVAPVGNLHFICRRLSLRICSLPKEGHGLRNPRVR